MIDRLADAGIPIDRCCRVLGVARQHYYRVKRKPMTQSELRRQWLTGLIRECMSPHAAPTVTAASTPS